MLIIAHILCISHFVLVFGVFRMRFVSQYHVVEVH